MNDLAKYFGRTLHHKRLSDSTGAIAGLASGVSVLCGLIAAHYAPRGVHRLAVFVHLGKQPLLVKLAPLVAGVAVAFAMAAGLIHFYSWCKDREAHLD
ncbi:MAG TPA: hypothetical protein VIY54_04035 [Steroidobacteraceae bacterium]